jgi:hypothetical protein
MKKLLILTAILAIGAVSSHAVLIEVSEASNTDKTGNGSGNGWASTDGGVTTNAAYAVSTQIIDGSASGSTLGYTISGLTIDGTGTGDDSVIINFSVAAMNAGSLSVIDTAADQKNTGWLAPTGTTLNGNEDSLTITFDSLSVLLNGSADATYTAASSFDGFTGVALGSWNADNHIGTVNGVQTVGGINIIDLTGTAGADTSLLATFTVVDGASDNDAGSWRPEAWDFQVTAIPEPATLGMVVAVGAGILFIRRRLHI